MEQNKAVLPADVARQWSNSVLNQALTIAENKPIPTDILKLDGIGSVTIQDGGTRISVAFHFSRRPNNG